MFTKNVHLLYRFVHTPPLSHNSPKMDAGLQHRKLWGKGDSVCWRESSACMQHVRARLLLRLEMTINNHVSIVWVVVNAQ